MSELVAWTVLALLLALTELAFAPAQSGSRSPRGAATDRLVQMLTVVAIVGPPLLALIRRSPPGLPALAIGVGIAASGIALRVVAMRVLGERFQLTPREVSEAPRLVTSGPYAVI